MYPKLFKYIFYIINYDICYTLYSNVKIKEKLHFITLNYISYYPLHPKFRISIQVNIKLDGRVQSVTNIIVYSVKYVFEKFKIQNIIRDI